MPVVYLGAKTGRDGVGGATMASAEFDDTIEDKRPTVQVGDPFTEKRLMEATLELMKTGAVISIQDMGAAGLTCSAVEMGDKGNLGVKLNLEDVPQREENMTAYEMMLSESQERMLMVLKPELEKIARAVFEKWDLDFAIVGETIAEDRFLVMHNGTIKADLPLKALSGTAPEYDRPWIETPKANKLENIPDVDPIKGLVAILGSANYGSKSWVYEQYDTMVMADTLVHPGSDAGVVRIHGTTKAVAFTSDVSPRYCNANPFEGGKQAVAEAYRNLSATGAKPLATTDNMNFGNPEKPEIMGQFVGCIKGIAEAVSVLDMPIVSGNVSLYNETDGSAILPTPTIGAVGLLSDISQIIKYTPNDGNELVLIGITKGHLGQSALLKELYGREEGDAPKVDLHAEKIAGDFVRSCHNQNLITAAHDVSDGGLSTAAVEMAIAANIGVSIIDGNTGWFFGEDQGRYLLACEDSNALIKAAEISGIPAQLIGHFGGKEIKLGSASIKINDVADAHESILKSLVN
jgi:phosphoribosylformylglycinamidine synthase